MGFQEVARAAWRELSTRPPGVLVDLGCGGGTLAHLAADAGWTVHGYDVSPSMIDLARQGPGTYAVGAAQEVELPPCDAATAIGEVWSYAAHQDLEAVPGAWKRIREALRPGGIFLFDVASPGRAPEPTHAAATGKGWRVEATARQEGDELVRTIDTWTPQHAREVHRLRLLDEAWVTATLEDAGFRVEALGCYDDHAFQQGWDAYAATPA